MIVDSCVLINASNGVQADLAAIQSLKALYIPQTAIGEFLAGVQEVQHPQAEAATLWFEQVLVDAVVLSPGRLTSKHYARLEQHTRRNGRPIPQNDLWIAATAAEHGLTLLTLDHHFQGLPGVDVQLVEPA